MAYAVQGVFFLLVSPFQALVVEQITLDPSAPPLPPPAIVTAVVVEPSTSRNCTLRLLPNGIVGLARPCGLDGWLNAVGAWRMTDELVYLLDVQQKPVLSFVRVGPRSFRTFRTASKSGTHVQLTLTLLSPRSLPLSGKQHADRLG